MIFESTQMKDAEENLPAVYHKYLREVAAQVYRYSRVRRSGLLIVLVNCPHGRNQFRALQRVGGRNCRPEVFHQTVRNFCLVPCLQINPQVPRKERW